MEPDCDYLSYIIETQKKYIDKLRDNCFKYRVALQVVSDNSAINRNSLALYLVGQSCKRVLDEVDDSCPFDGVLEEPVVEETHHCKSCGRVGSINENWYSVIFPCQNETYNVYFCASCGSNKEIYNNNKHIVQTVRGCNHCKAEQYCKREI